MIKLAELRKKKGLTQKELADILGVSESTISMYETGDRIPSLFKAKKMAKFFNVKVEEIFFGKENHVTRANNKSQSEQSA
jgi:putative transcriptional regulator